jgi:hypothetical protein
MGVDPFSPVASGHDNRLAIELRNDVLPSRAGEQLELGAAFANFDPTPEHEAFLIVYTDPEGPTMSASCAICREEGGRRDKAPLPMSRRIYVKAGPLDIRTRPPPNRRRENDAIAIHAEYCGGLVRPDAAAPTVPQQMDRLQCLIDLTKERCRTDSGLNVADHLENSAAGRNSHVSAS